MDKDDVTILCNVVDNYGDIGVVYRLARALTARRPALRLRLRLIVSDLHAFAALAPGIDPAASVQTYRAWEVHRWDGGAGDWGQPAQTAETARGETPAGTQIDAAPGEIPATTEIEATHSDAPEALRGSARVCAAVELVAPPRMDTAQNAREKTPAQTHGNATQRGAPEALRERACAAAPGSAPCPSAAAFRADPPSVILECFQCGRPGWLDEILFDPGFTRTVHIVNIDYLTAEPYADEFHLLKSGTRRASIKKINFMPGFTPHTGGLILDAEFMRTLAERESCGILRTTGDEHARIPSGNGIGAPFLRTEAPHRDTTAQTETAATHDDLPGATENAARAEAEPICPQNWLQTARMNCKNSHDTNSKSARFHIDTTETERKNNAPGDSVTATGRTPHTAGESPGFTVLVFAYERDFSPVAAALAQFQRAARRHDAALSVRALVAAGKSGAPFLAAWERAGKPFDAAPLPFLPQESWDALLCRADFLFVRGEDSLARACLARRPFVWHAYPQDGGYQLVKVDALLSRLERHFPEERAADFARLALVWRWYNGAPEIRPDDAVPALATLLESARNGALAAPFQDFAQSLLANGDLAAHLLDYIDSLP